MLGRRQEKLRPGTPPSQMAGTTEHGAARSSASTSSLSKDRKPTRHGLPSSSAMTQPTPRPPGLAEASRSQRGLATRPGSDAVIVTHGCYVRSTEPPVVSIEHKRAGLCTAEQVPDLVMPDSYKRTVAGSLSEAGERQRCEAANEAKLAPKLEKVVERLQADAPNVRRPGADLIAHYLDPDRLPARDRSSRKRADTQRRLCERFASPFSLSDIYRGNRSTTAVAVVGGGCRQLSAAP